MMIKKLNEVVPPEMTETVFMTVKQLRSLINEVGLNKHASSFVEWLKGVYQYTPTNIDEIISQIRLNDVIVKKQLGCGAIGCAFLLSNGNVLKLMVDSDGAQYRFYKQLLDRLHSRSATKKTPMVYDLGQIRAYANKNYGGPIVTWVELEYLTPEENSVGSYNTRIYNDIVEAFFTAVVEKLYPTHINKHDDVKAVLDKYSDDDLYRMVLKVLDERKVNIDDQMSSAARDNYIYAMIDAVRTHPSAIDLHTGNLGHRGKDAVFFDPFAFE